MTKPMALLCASVLLAVASIPVHAQTPQKGEGNAAKPQNEAQEQAKKIFGRDCALCHGQTGDGQTELAKSLSLSLHDWTDPKTLSSRSDQELFAIIRKGKDMMPVEDQGRASDDQVKSLIQFIRDFAKQNAQAAPGGGK